VSLLLDVGVSVRHGNANLTIPASTIGSAVELTDIDAFSAQFRKPSVAALGPVAVGPSFMTVRSALLLSLMTLRAAGVVPSGRLI
jgi:hypothetical protein